MTTLDELARPLSKEEIAEAIYAAIEARGVATSGWKPGAVARTIIAGASIVLSAFSTLQTRIAKSGFLELAEEEWLTLVALHVYGVARSDGTFAAGYVVLDNSAGGMFSVDTGDMIVATSTTGKTYRNTEAFTLSPMESGKLVPIQAVESGSDSTAPPGTIDTLETVMLGVAVTNPLALVGTDPDSDQALRDKCLAKIGTLSPNGPGDAYRFVAFAAKKDDGTPVGITRLTTVPDGEGNVDVYVATATGEVTGSVGDTATDLGAVDRAIQTQVVPLAVTATTASATALPVSVTAEVWVDGSVGLTPGEIESRIANSLSSFMSRQPIGGSRKTAGAGYVFKQAVEAAISEAVGSAFLIDKAVTDPAADAAVAANEAPTLGATTISVHLVSL